MVDFVEEVEEQLRAERYAALAKRVLPWFAAALGAVVLGWLSVWGYDLWRNHNIETASVAYDKGLAALVSGDQTGAYTAFDPIAKSGPAGYRALALMQQGDIRAQADKGSEAAALYDSAAKAAPNVVFGDLARLRAALVLMDNAPFPQIKTRLDVLIGDKRPFTLEAREALAMAKLQAGKVQEARGDFNALTLTLGVSQQMRSRAQSAIALIDGGQSKAAGEAVQAAAGLPPMDPASLAALIGAPPAQAQAPVAPNSPQDAAVAQ